MFDAEIPNELILIAAEAIAHPQCGKMRFSMLDSAEWQVLIELAPTVGDMAQDVYCIIRSRPQLPLVCVIADVYTGAVNRKEKPFASLQDCVAEAIAYFKELEEA